MIWIVSKRADAAAVKRWNWLPAGLLVLLLAACATPPPQNQFPELTYGHLEPIRLAVGEVRVEQAYTPSLAPPQVEHIMPVAPAAAATRWARDRLQATGGDLSAIFVVRDASVTETNLPRTGGLQGVFTTDASERYDARLVVELIVRNAGGRTIGVATAQADRSQTVLENISLKEREQIWFDMVDRLMQDINRQLEQTIPEALYPYVAA